MDFYWKGHEEDGLQWRLDQFSDEMHILCVILNHYHDTTHENIVPTRGLRQGDSLSPYLFLLCAEGFSAIILDATRTKQLNGTSICRGAPKITHLIFANDSLLFCRANGDECNKLKEILGIYEFALGQKINTDKSFIFFSWNTSQELKDEILNILRPMQDSRHSKYLGLPSIIGRSKKAYLCGDWGKGLQEAD